MSELSQNTQKLIQKYQVWYSQLQPEEGIATIHVDEVASKVAAFYEKIRGVVDWREEHLMRRAAIERMLKRRLLLSKDAEEIAQSSVLELIRGGHFPNDRIEESKTEEVRKIIDKYVFVLDNSPQPPTEKIKAQLYDWLLSIAACEIEETLAPPKRETALIEYMAELMEERIEFKKLEIPEEKKKKQIYIAVQKALFKLDNPFIAYSLLKKMYPQWRDFNGTHPQLKEIAQNVYSIWGSIEKDFKHPLAEKIYRVCERYDTPYLILSDVISENPPSISETLEKPELFEEKITQAYKNRFVALKAKVRRAAIYATLSIFVTKILLAFAVEVPFDKYVTGQFSSSALGLNILIPPLLMFFLILTIRPPKPANLQQVILETMKITYKTERKDVYQIAPPRKRGWLINIFLTIFYLLTFCVSFGLIIWGLQKLDFGVLSIIIFLVFVSLISFAGIKIRERSRELEVIREKESVFVIFIDFFSLPLIRIGRWLSSQWTRFNVIVILFNFLLDLPFQSFIEFLEQWRAFLKEKKEEIH